MIKNIKYTSTNNLNRTSNGLQFYRLKHLLINSITQDRIFNSASACILCFHYKIYISYFFSFAVPIYFTVYLSICILHGKRWQETVGKQNNLFIHSTHFDYQSYRQWTHGMRERSWWTDHSKWTVLE